MPRAVNLDAYPNEEFWALTQRVLGGEDVRIACAGGMAQSLRGQFYAWRRACEALPEEAARLGIDSRVLRQVSLASVEGGLKAVQSGTMPIPKLLREALGMSQEPTGDAAESLARLQALIGKGGGNG